MNNNANASNGGGGRRRNHQKKKKKKGPNNSNGSSLNRVNHPNNQNEHDEFIASFQLNISVASSPILVRNGITKLWNGCYSAKMIKKYFDNTNPHNIDLQIVQIWKVNH